MFCLSDLAKTWYLNREADFTTWAIFSSRAKELFGRPAARKADAEHKLARRSQQIGESYVSYIEDVLSLCARVDASMPEIDKVKHIRKGISDAAFHYFLLKSPSTVPEAIQVCQDLNDATTSRVVSGTLDKASGYSSAPLHPSLVVDDLRTMIRDIIREELARCSHVTPSSLCTSAPFSFASLQSMVRQELTAALSQDGPPPQIRPTHQSPTYADVLRSPPPPPVDQRVPSYASPSVPFTPPLAPFSPLYTAPFYPPRSPETRSCFYCGIRGHLARNCRKRRRDAEALSRAPTGYPSPRSNFTEESHPRDQYSPRPMSPPPPRRRSPSPYRQRATTRSPIRARSPAPQENP